MCAARSWYVWHVFSSNIRTLAEISWSNLPKLLKSSVTWAILCKWFQQLLFKMLLLGSLSFRMCPLPKKFNSNLNHLPQKIILPNSAFSCLSSRFLVTCGYYEIKLSTKPFQVVEFVTFLSRYKISACEVRVHAQKAKCGLKNFSLFFALAFGSLLPIFFVPLTPFFLSLDR